MLKIKLTKGKYALIDNEDFKKISSITWHCSSEGYAIHSLHKKPYAILMHRMIMKTPQGKDTDHINGNRLDNRKHNLRICSRSENLRNSKKTIFKRSSKYKGVSWDKNNNNWMAQIYRNGKAYFIGRYNNEVEAANIYNKIAKKHFGKFAKLNLC